MHEILRRKAEKSVLKNHPKITKKRNIFNTFSSNFNSDEYCYLKSTTQFIIYCFLILFICLFLTHIFSVSDFHFSLRMLQLLVLKECTCRQFMPHHSLLSTLVSTTLCSHKLYYSDFWGHINQSFTFYYEKKSLLWKVKCILVHLP